MTQLVNDLHSIKEYLDIVGSEGLIELHNIFCSESNDPDSEIFNNDKDFFDQFFDGDPWKAVNAAYYGGYDPSDRYVQFDGYGNLRSFFHAENWVDLNELADAIMENPSAYNIQLI